MMERYSNKRPVYRKAGRFTTPPSLKEQGYDVADGSERPCAHCGIKSRPILNTGWKCHHCGERNP